MMADRPGHVTTPDAINAFIGGISFFLTTPRTWPLAVVPAAMLTILRFALTAVGFAKKSDDVELRNQGKWVFDLTPPSISYQLYSSR
jgi:hypothetical protein